MQALEWKTEKRRFNELIPYEHNPRILTDKKRAILEESIKKYGFVEIPAIDADNILIAGHQRAQVMIALGRGEEFTDVRVPNRKLTTKEFKEYNITSNVSIGVWDLDELNENFGDIDLMTLGLDINSIQLPDELRIKEEVEEPEIPLLSQKPPISAPGDSFQLGAHRLLVGSSTLPDDLAKLFDGKLADLVVTDPPYNVNYEGEEGMKILNDKMDDGSFYQFLYDFYTNAYSYMKAGAAVYVFHADTEGVNFRKALTDAGLKLAQCLVWVKNSIVMGRQDFHWKHEPILYGWKEGAAHNWYSDRCQSTVLDFNRPLRNEIHPTMKPLDLIEYLIVTSSKQGDIVFDGFLGSGSTLIASERLGRKCYGTELDPAYADVIITRYLNYCKAAGKLPVFKHINGRLSHEQFETYE